MTLKRLFLAKNISIIHTYKLIYIAKQLRAKPPEPRLRYITLHQFAQRSTSLRRFRVEYFNFLAQVLLSHLLPKYLNARLYVNTFFFLLKD